MRDQEGRGPPDTSRLLFRRRAMGASGSWYHLSVKTVGRSAGRSVVAAAAYRLGACLHDKEVAVTHDYTRRHGVHMTHTVAPESAPEWVYDPARLWNEANAAEKRVNSTLAREAELALPASLTNEARALIVQDFLAGAGGPLRGGGHGGHP